MIPTEDLCKACNSNGLLRLIVKETSQPERVVELPAPFAVIGRAPDCDLVLDDEDVSRRHAYLQIINGRVWCFDMLSRTGIYHGSGQEIAGWVDHSKEFRIGPYKLRSLSGDSAVPVVTNPLLASTAKVDPLPSVSVEFPNTVSAEGDEQAPFWKLDRVVTLIGRSTPCKIRFNCPTVSRIHCSLLRTPMGVWAIDLLGHDGILINGQPVRSALLCDGDCLQVGRFFQMNVRVAARRNSKKPPLLTVSPANLQPLRNETVRALTRTRAPEAAIALSPNGAAQGPSAIVGPIESHLAAVSQVPEPLAAEANGGDATQALLLMFTQQFSMMQQQMFDQFQQTTSMMMQMFGSLQRDQFALVREELNEIRALNLEISAVQAEMQKARAAQLAESTNIQRGTSTSVADASSLAPKSLPAASPSRSDVRANPATGREKDSVREATQRKERFTPAATQVSPSSSPQPPNSKPAAHGAGENGKPTVQTPANPPGDEVYTWLSGRFADLQQERQTRWQKLVSRFMGK